MTSWVITWSLNARKFLVVAFTMINSPCLLNIRNIVRTPSRVDLENVGDAHECSKWEQDVGHGRLFQLNAVSIKSNSYCKHSMADIIKHLLELF